MGRWIFYSPTPSILFLNRFKATIEANMKDLRKDIKTGLDLGLALGKGTKLSVAIQIYAFNIYHIGDRLYNLYPQ